jgi:hypothetical protein
MFDIDFLKRRRCLEHLADVIDRAPLVLSPFPHFVVRPFFPADVYAALLDLLPGGDLYRPFAYDKHHNPDGESNRRHFEMSDRALEQLEPRNRRFWRTIRSVAGSAELKQLTFTKLAPALVFRYGIRPDEVPNLPGFALPELFCESAGYSLKPHPDTRREVVTMQIALARDATQRGLGTEFYRRSANPLMWARAPRGFIVARTMDFLPNSAYAFAVLNTWRRTSWHGCRAIPASCGERHSLLNIWYEKAEDSNPDLIAENGWLERALATTAAAA